MEAALAKIYISLPIAFLAGIIPCCLWLWFWLREDRLHPEPRSRIVKTFIAGMAMVLLVLPFEQMAGDYFKDNLTLLFVWSSIEEFFKFAAAYVIAFSNKDYDEPIDAVIYMITVALGFAALENAFYILKPLHDGLVLNSLVTGNLRFVGSTLLHTAASATVGIFMAFEFYKSRTVGRFWTAMGLLCAIVLHTLFNITIILESGGETMYAFYSVWLLIIIILLLFEKVKNIKNIYGQR